MPESTKYMLGIDFQDGFKNDTILVKINGIEVFKEENITTSLTLGLATSYKTYMEKRNITIHFSIPTKDLDHDLTLYITNDTYLGVSLIDGMINIITSDKPFTYL